MKKHLLTFLALLLAISSYGQSWNNTGNVLQRKIAGSDTSYRFSLGSPGFMYLYTKPQVNALIRTQSIRTDSVRDNLLPVGLQGQQLRVKGDNTNSYYAGDPWLYGKFVYNDAQLARAISSGKASQLQIFNSFNRFSHGTTPVDPELVVPSNNIPGNPSQTNSFAYDTVTSVINSTYNTGTAIGFYSKEKFDRYTHTATLSATGTDNDNIGLVIAFVEDTTDMVTNYAYGLNPADFNWPINTTSPTIPNQHVLTLYRCRNGISPSYYVAYDLEKLTQQIILNGNSQPGLFRPITDWASRSVDVRVERAGDTIRVYTTNMSDASGGKGALRFMMQFNLNSNPVLEKFKGKQSYGYSNQSQANATFTNIDFSETSNVIYDLRNGYIYQYVNSAYTVDPNKNLYTDYGSRYFWRNPDEKTFGTILPNATYDVIVGATP